MVTDHDQHGLLSALDAVFRQALDAAAVVDATAPGTIVYANPAFAALTGFDARTVAGREVSLFDAAADGDGIPLSRLVLAAESIRTETCLRRRDGERLRGEVAISPLAGASASLVVVIIRDVTGRRAAEAALLSQANDLLEEAVGSLEEALSLWDEDERLLLANPRFVRLFEPCADLIKPGIGFEDLLRANIEHGCYRVAGDVESWIAQRLAARRRDVHVQEFELADGCHYRLTERKTPQGRTVTIWVDITALIRAEQRLRDAIDSVTEGFVLFDAEERLVLCNSRFRNLFGPVADRIVPGIGYSELIELWPEAADGSAHERGTRTAARLRTFRRGGRHEQQLPDGRWLLASFRRTVDGGVVGVQTDVTLIKRQELALRRSKEMLREHVTELEVVRGQLEAKTSALSDLAARYLQARNDAEDASHSKSRFLATMSHEFRTPLNAIIGFSELITSQAFGPLGTPRYGEYARDIHSSGLHLLELISDILDMSKIEAGKYVLHRGPVCPADAIRHCLRMVTLRAEEAGIRLEHSVDKGLPVLEADERAFRQVLLNLLSNGIKFTERGGCVTVTASADDRSLSVTVADTGIGIPHECLARIGQPFEQVENHHTRQHAGTGLGLALTRSLIELHGGRMKIDSEPGKGTCIHVELPIRADAAETVAATAS